MAQLTLVIGDKNRSSWSLRPWLALKHTGTSFDEVVIRLDRPDTARQIAQWSPGKKVPALRDGELVVWESLAICEYVAERFPEAKLWPVDRVARAVARSVSMEMHAGFAELRRACSMRIAERLPAPELTSALKADLQRVFEIWSTCRDRYGRGGPFLFGPFTIADAMYAPVVGRLVTYGIPVEASLRQYMDAVLALPAMQEWIAGARRELGK